MWPATQHLRALVGAALAALPAPAALACSWPEARERLAAVSDGGELTLQSGQVLRLAGLRLAEQPEERTRALTRLREAAGREVTVASDPAGADRWGRVPARVAPADDPQADIGGALVGAGLALVDPSRLDPLCRPNLLALEAAARAHGAGLWARGERFVEATDRAALRAAAGRFVVVEGRIVSVGERARRTYLNFGRDFATDLAITLPRPLAVALRRQGLDAASLRGRRVRARGVIEIWRGPVMELSGPDVLEVLDREARGPAR